MATASVFQCLCPGLCGSTPGRHRVDLDLLHSTHGCEGSSVICRVVEAGLRMKPRTQASLVSS